MEILDAFKTVFDTTTLIHAINHIDHVPQRIEALGLFDVEPISTTTVVIEENYGTVTLVPAAPRGGVPEPVSRDRRKAIPFQIQHLPTMFSVMADEVQNVRGFASGGRAVSEQAGVEQVRDIKLGKAERRINATIEHHRMGAIKGKILDANGSTELLDLFTTFGVTQNTHGFDMDVATVSLTQKIREAQRKSLVAMGNQMVTGWHAFCSDSFFDLLLQNDDLQKLYLNHQAAAQLRDDSYTYSVFPFGGVNWENYRGKVGAVDYIADGKAYLVPMGVPDLFINYFGPADYVETVGTMGLPFYSKAEMMKMGKGIEVEAQSNPLCLCTKPAAVIELDATGS